jgi:uncharacterized phage protein (TIGR02216 family)
MTSFDWPALMQLGMRQMALKPDEFWSLTPIELLIISGTLRRRNDAMTRSVFSALCNQFPDHETE